MNINCVICSDLFGPSDNIFTTSCGHIFHHHCVSQWLERSKTCPQCRQKCNMRSIFRVYFNHSSNSQLDTPEDTASLHDKIDSLHLLIREKDTILKNNIGEASKHKQENKKCMQTIQRLELHVDQNKQIIRTLRQEVELLGATKKSYNDLEKENNVLQTKLASMEVIQTVLNATQKEADEILKQNLDVKSMSVIIGALKRELCGNDIRKQELKKQLQLVQRDFRQECEKRKAAEEKLQFFESENHRLNSRLKRIRTDGESTEASQYNNDDVMFLDSPEVKKKKFSLGFEGAQNTPSPMSSSIFKDRVAQVKESNSPYFKIKSSSVGLAPLLRTKSSEALTGFLSQVPKNKQILGHVPRSLDTKNFEPLSIFKKARVDTKQLGKFASSFVPNGMGGSQKVLMSDLRKPTSTLDEGSVQSINDFQKKIKPKVKDFSQ